MERKHRRRSCTKNERVIIRIIITGAAWATSVFPTSRYPDMNDVPWFSCVCRKAKLTRDVSGLFAEAVGRGREQLIPEFGAPRGRWCECVVSAISQRRAKIYALFGEGRGANRGLSDGG